MELYLNGALIGLRPEAEDVEDAFRELLNGDEGRMLLRRGMRSSLEVLRGEDGSFCVSLEKGDALYGVVMHEALAGEVAKALVEFLAGATPRLVDASHYAYEADCPLCAAMAAQEAKANSSMN
ncbi:MAG: hypothetical protein WC943_07735 [Elusimicrobiota bacterium]|jgi:hypothetical protein